MDYDVTYRFNNYRFRSPDFNLAIVYDAVLLGDSSFSASLIPISGPRR